MDLENVKPYVFIEFEKYNRFEFPEISDFMSEYSDICIVDEKHIQFKVVGILYATGVPVVVFPKNYQLDKNYLIADARMLIRVLVNYRNEPQHDIVELPLLFGDDNLTTDKVILAMLLLEDFCQNGFLHRELQIESIEQAGRISWPSTIYKTLPIVSQNRIRYLNPIYKRKVTDRQNIISIIHQVIITECFATWGWLFDYDGFKEEPKLLPGNPSELVHLLTLELRNTFVEREIRVLKLLLQYLTKKSEDKIQQKLNIIATSNFNNVWESVCGYLFENQYAKLQKLIPQPQWEDTYLHNRISQRPDIYYVTKSSLFVLDAKYYNHNISLPGWYDVVKQFFYRHSLVKILHRREFYEVLPKTKHIYNAFLLPGNEENILTYIGKANVPMIEDLGEIKAFTINLRRSLYAYAYRNDYDFQEKLRQQLQENFPGV